MKSKLSLVAGGLVLAACLGGDQLLDPGKAFFAVVSDDPAAIDTNGDGIVCMNGSIYRDNTLDVGPPGKKKVPPKKKPPKKKATKKKKGPGGGQGPPDGCPVGWDQVSIP